MKTAMLTLVAKLLCICLICTIMAPVSAMAKTHIPNDGGSDNVNRTWKEGKDTYHLRCVKTNNDPIRIIIKMLTENPLHYTKGAPPQSITISNRITVEKKTSSTLSSSIGLSVPLFKIAEISGSLGGSVTTEARYVKKVQTDYTVQLSRSDQTGFYGYAHLVDANKYFCKLYKNQVTANQLVAQGELLSVIKPSGYHKLLRSPDSTRLQPNKIVNNGMFVDRP